MALVVFSITSRLFHKSTTEMNYSTGVVAYYSRTIVNSSPALLDGIAQSTTAQLQLTQANPNPTQLVPNKHCSSSKEHIINENSQLLLLVRLLTRQNKGLVPGACWVRKSYIRENISVQRVTLCNIVSQIDP